MKKRILAVAGVVAVVGLSVLPGFLPFAHAQYSSSTFGTQLDTLGTQVSDFFSILIAKWWWVILGVTLIVGAIGFVIGKAGGMFHGGHKRR